MHIALQRASLPGEAEDKKNERCHGFEIHSRSALLALVFAAILVQTNVASAVTVEVARKCQAFTSKAFPPREPGNPAADSAKGSGLDEQSYFKRCVANGGRVDDASPKEGNRPLRGDKAWMTSAGLGTIFAFSSIA